MDIKLSIELEMYHKIAKKVREDLIALLGDAYKSKTYYLLIKSLSAGSTVVSAQLAIPENEEIDITFTKVKNQL